LDGHRVPNQKQPKIVVVVVVVVRLFPLTIALFGILGLPHPMAESKEGSTASAAVATTTASGGEGGNSETIPKDNREYGSHGYWEKRFASEASYEWLANYSVVRPLLSKRLNRTDRILHVGCGNSGNLSQSSAHLLSSSSSSSSSSCVETDLAADLYKDGYTNITNIDYSSVVIQHQSNSACHCVSRVMFHMLLTHIHM
jgi:hypothetical protein